MSTRSSIELSIRVQDAASTKLDIPGYAPFSIQAGVNESTVAIDGIGMLEQHPRGKVVFRAGNIDFDDPYSLLVMRRWLAIARPPVTIHIGQLTLPLPSDLSVLDALSVLTAKQKHFRAAVLGNTIYFPDEL